MKIFSFVLIALFSLSLFAREADDNLTLKLAKERKAQVKNISYELFFDLKEGSENFSGITTMNVDLNHLRRPLTIDSLISKISTVKVNGEELKNFPQRKGSFDIPVKHLKSSMKIEVVYSSEFTQEGHGFKRMVDPEDKEEYLYSDFEPYYAHWLFPCFDQPDLKATYTVTVKSPAKWKIVHNELLKNEKVEGKFKISSFEKTKPFSTYLFFLGAGPWEEWTDKHENTPLVIHARKSMAKFVDHKRQFVTLKKGLAFFNEYFGYPYPFSKYGQIFVPDFAAGAMENPGAVTFNEQRFLYRGAVAKTQYEGRDNTILHEMAHMWFGDLVTMEWWNDLWLNESFATYAATLAQDRAMGGAADIDFLETKNWGYWQDQLVTTHPIETHLKDVRGSKGIFDGITYAKGGSALKQLHFYVGEEGFRDGLRHYFKTYAWKNTQRKDFINSIALASKKDLNDWTKKWLQTAGPNKVNLKYDCQDGKVSRAEILQERNKGGVFSPHRTKIRFYKLENDSLVPGESFDVTFSSNKTLLKEMQGASCPDFVLPNIEDHDYALYSLDEKSLKLASIAMKKLPDPLERYQIWLVLLEMVRQRQLKPTEFFSMALDALRTEKDEILLGTLLGRWSLVRNEYFYYLSKEERVVLAPQFEGLLWDRIANEKSDSSAQITFTEFLISIAQTKESLDKLHKMYKDFDADKRWAVIRTLALNNYPGILSIIETEETKDNSTLGKRMALAAKVAIPTLENKKAQFALLKPKKLPYSDFREAADNFFTLNYPEINEPFLKEFYKEVTTIDWSSNDDIVSVYFNSFFPYEACTKENEKMSAKGLKTARNLTNIARKSWLEAHDELERCVKVRKPR